MNSLIYAHALTFLVSEDGDVYSPGGINNQYFGRFRDAGFEKIELVSRFRVISGKPPPEYTYLEGVDATSFSKFGTGYWFLFNLRFYLTFFRRMKVNHFVVVNYPSVTGIFILVFLYLFRQPYIVEVASDSNQYEGKKFGSFVDTVSNIVGRICIPRAVGALYVAEFLREKWKCSNYLVLSNVHIEELGRARVLNTKNREYKIVTVGAVSYRKGIDTLINALMSGDMQSRYKLSIAGPILDRALLEVIAAARNLGLEIELHGILSVDQVKSLLDKSDLYVQASRSEGLPRSVIEAMARGLPVVASKLPGLVGLLPKCCLFSIENHTQAGEIIEKIVSQHSVYDGLSKHSINSASPFLLSHTRSKRASFYIKCHDLVTFKHSE